MDGVVGAHIVESALIYGSSHKCDNGGTAESAPNFFGLICFGTALSITTITNIVFVVIAISYKQVLNYRGLKTYVEQV